MGKQIPPGKAPGGQTTFVADHQVDRQKPLHQGQYSGVKLCVCRLRGRYPLPVIVPAFRTLKVTGSSLLLQRLCTGLLSKTGNPIQRQ
jgi:hypothetical protein